LKCWVRRTRQRSSAGPRHGFGGSEGSISFLKKRNKKLLNVARSGSAKHEASVMH
jgi:hypothetical protein